MNVRVELATASEMIVEFDQWHRLFIDAKEVGGVLKFDIDEIGKSITSRNTSEPGKRIEKFHLIFPDSSSSMTRRFELPDSPDLIAECSWQAALSEMNDVIDGHPAVTLRPAATIAEIRSNRCSASILNYPVAGQSRNSTHPMCRQGAIRMRLFQDVKRHIIEKCRRFVLAWRMRFKVSQHSNHGD